MKLNERLKNCEFKMRWFRVYLVWIWIVMIHNFGQLLTIMDYFVKPYNLYDIEYFVIKAIISTTIVVLFYITYRCLVMFKKIGYILNNCLIFASTLLPSISFALDSYFTSFSNRYDADVALGCFWFMFIPLLLFWFLPNAIYFDKRKKIFSDEEKLNEESVYNLEKTKNIESMATKENKATETNEQVAFCRKCGTQLLNDSEFCHKCGCEKVR